MTDSDATAQAALRTLATRTIDHGWGRAIDHGGGSGQIVTHPTLVLQKAPALAAAAAFIEADRWAGYEREATFGGTFLSDNARNGVLVDGPAAAARTMATGLRTELARTVLQLAVGDGCGLAAPDDHAHVGALAQALEMHAPLLRAAVGMDKPIPTDNDAAQEIDPATGRLVWDERLARYLEGLGKIGAQAAQAVREESTDPRQADLLDPVGASLRLWRLWLPFPSALVDAFEREDVREAARAFTDVPSEAPGPWSGAHGPWKPERETPKAWLRLGWALWFDVVAPELRQDAAKRRAARGTIRAMRTGVAAQLAEFAPGGRIDHAASDDTQLTIRFPPGGSAMLRTGLGLDIAPLLANLDVVAQISMQRVLGAVAHHAAEGWRRAMAGEQNAGQRWRFKSERDVARFVADAWDDLDEKSLNGAARKRLAEALDYGTALELPNPTNPTLKPIRLWELEQRQVGKRVERLLTPLAALVPSDAFADFDGDRKALRDARRLVPMPRRFPSHEAFPGPVRAPAVSAWLLRVLPELRRRAFDYATKGLDCKRIVRHAFDQSGIGEHAAEAWRLWSTGADADFAPFKDSARRWTLNPKKHPEAHEALRRAGSMEKPARLRKPTARKR